MTDQETIEKATRIMASTPPADLIQALADAGLLADPQALQDLSDARNDLKQAMTERIEKAEAERDALAERARKFSDDLGFGDGKTEPVASLDDMTEPLLAALNAERDHYECPVICELCGEWLASATCEHCQGSGCGPGTAMGAYQECEWCAGVGKVHEDCVEKSYVDLVTERNALAATVQRVRELAEGWHSRGEHDMEFSKQIPEDVREVIYEAGCEMVERARLVRNALDDPQEQP